MIGSHRADQDQIDISRTDARFLEAISSGQIGDVAGRLFGWAVAALENARPLHNPVFIAPQSPQLTVRNDRLRNVRAGSDDANARQTGRTGGRREPWRRFRAFLPSS